MKKHDAGSMLFGSVLFLLVFTLASCSTMSITAEWKDSKYTRGPFKKYIVIGLFKKLSMRQSFEDAVASALGKNGVEAISSLTVLTPDREIKIKKNDKDLDDFLHVLGVDGIVIIRLLGLDKSQKYIPGSTYYAPGPGYPYGGPYMNYYYNYYYPVSTPGYYEDFISVNLECMLFANDTNKMIWKAEAESIPYDEGSKELSAPEKSASDLAALLMREFKKNGYMAVKK